MSTACNHCIYVHAYIYIYIYIYIFMYYVSARFFLPNGVKIEYAELLLEA